ncbi:hypothetical protein SODALDRAFT_267438 [Sodiomyces alkalinus F11]|uniref:N-acetyltransferase domain-containing protein n=1 Tax=Sodiomyces alkalinus (strain CBS 110278 / VKM F-3762 / F11) TaxID=1314773 RepID=A0A3N2Q696_SODAK|nr:hypothetical protein SODALDRAFT_267438 [Sodiomyces alkalinus F11]ROT42227.1 hypothetical protein SODALDRAFT_267438 [Sodiomyces alkalinus F11]
MSFVLSDVDISNAESLSRYVEVPAIWNTPLFRVMFPSAENMHETERDEVVRWYADMLRDAPKNRAETFLQAFIDGIPVGLCAWTTIERRREMESAGQLSKDPSRRSANTKNWLPLTLDVDGWLSLSKELKMERERILKDLDNICRLTIMSVNPDHQRRGIGSAFMQRICGEINLHGRHAFVLAAPEGVPLYAKFGFKVIGHVDSPHGMISSMFRPSRNRTTSSTAPIR